ncbi:hypothetical protein ACHAWF_002877, partial [Thalassiosira exigua]
MQPRPPSPVAMMLEGVQRLEDEERRRGGGDGGADDGGRPHAPVAKVLLSQPSSTADEAEGMAEEEAGAGAATGPAAREATATASRIPNLLTSGQFPPAPHSPRHHRGSLLSASPPTIASSPRPPVDAMSSPLLPAAPPSTPYTPYGVPPLPIGTSAAGAVGGGSGPSSVPALHPPLPPALSAASSTSPSLSRRPRVGSPPPSAVSSSPFGSPLPVDERPPAATGGRLLPVPPVSPGSMQIDPRHDALLRRALEEATERERSRAASLAEIEAGYETIEEYRLALARERRHSTNLARELARSDFMARYAACGAHVAEELEEEARINHLIKGIDHLKKDMNESRCRAVMELEREEERMINTLVARLEEVTREKRLLETQIGSARGEIGDDEMGAPGELPAGAGASGFERPTGAAASAAARPP